MKALLFIGTAAVLLFVLIPNLSAGTLENPTHNTLEKDGRLEIRHYPSMTVARTELRGAYSDSLSNGFRQIAGYIFGGNLSGEKIAMTAPVIVERPVNSSEAYDMWFVMPRANVAAGLPDPTSSTVVLEDQALGRVASWRFGGWATEDRVDRQWEKFQARLTEKGIQYEQGYWVAQYNSPYAPPPFRKNEIWVRVVE